VAAIFRLNVIDEGVETEKQFELLNTFGCMTYQGCLFRKPVVIDEFEAKQNSNYAAKINSNDI
jgi:EAL domain-containing protein (putative c-di-GMP-specific phosphodiesterase class I)